jgi:hypothetical protein
MLTAKRPSTARRRRRGCSGRPTDAATRRAPRAPQSKGRSSSKLAGVDQAAWARSTGVGLDGDGGDWRRGLTKPHGQEDERDEAEQVRQRAAANLAGARQSRARSTSVTWIARKGLGLGFDREGRE